MSAAAPTQVPAAAPLASVLVPIQKRLIKWDENGYPVLSSEPVLARGQIQSLYFAAASQPFVVDDPLDPDFGRYDNMTVAEVLVRKQIEKAAKSGDVATIEIVMDRLIGRPLSISENLNVNASYESYLKNLADKSNASIETTSLVDKTVVPSEDVDDPLAEFR